MLPIFASTRPIVDMLDYWALTGNNWSKLRVAFVLFDWLVFVINVHKKCLWGLPATLQRNLYVQHIRVGHPRAETTPPRRDSVLQNQTWTDPCRLPNSMSEHQQATSSDIIKPHIPVFVLRPLCTSLETPTSVGNRLPERSTVPDGRLPNYQSPVMLHVGF